jgi:hypothetical protein
MGSKYLLPLLCIVLFAFSIPLWANPFVTDLRDGNKGSPIQLFIESRDAGIPSSILAPGLRGQNALPSDFSDNFGRLSIFPAPSASRGLPVQIAVLFQNCSAGPVCLYGVGLMLSAKGR